MFQDLKPSDKGRLNSEIDDMKSSIIPDENYTLIIESWKSPSATAHFEIRDDQFSLMEFSASLNDDTTFPQLEYHAMIYGFAACKQAGITMLQVLTKKEDVYRQMIGIYAVNSENIRPLYNSAIQMMQGMAVDFEFRSKEQLYGNKLTAKEDMNKSVKKSLTKKVSRSENRANLQRKPSTDKENEDENFGLNASQTRKKVRTSENKNLNENNSPKNDENKNNTSRFLVFESPEKIKHGKISDQDFKKTEEFFELQKILTLIDDSTYNFDTIKTLSPEDIDELKEKFGEDAKKLFEGKLKVVKHVFDQIKNGNISKIR
jgi:ribonuclease HI